MRAGSYPVHFCHATDFLSPSNQHRPFPGSPPAFGLSQGITDTNHQLLISPMGSTRFYSTLGNTETHAAAPLLSIETSFARQWRQSPSPGCFSWKGLSFGWPRWGRWNFRRHVFQSECLHPESGDCVCFVFALSFWGGKSFPVSEEKAHVPSAPCIAGFSPSTRKSSEKRPRADGKVLG